MGYHLETSGERIMPRVSSLQQGDTMSPEWAAVMSGAEIDDLNDAMWAALETSEALGQEPVHVVDETGESQALIESRPHVGCVRRTREFMAAQAKE
jgi:hypothetical protein